MRIVAESEMPERIAVRRVGKAPLHLKGISRDVREVVVRTGDHDVGVTGISRNRVRQVVEPEVRKPTGSELPGLLVPRQPRRWGIRMPVFKPALGVPAESGEFVEDVRQAQYKLLVPEEFSSNAT
jgi:hypothetical protein